MVDQIDKAIKILKLGGQNVKQVKVNDQDFSKIVKAAGKHYEKTPKSWEVHDKMIGQYIDPIEDEEMQESESGVRTHPVANDAALRSILGLD